MKSKKDSTRILLAIFASTIVFLMIICAHAFGDALFGDLEFPSTDTDTDSDTAQTDCSSHLFTSWEYCDQAYHFRECLRCGTVEYEEHAEHTLDQYCQRCHSTVISYGDTDGNGQINLKDLVLLRTYLANFDYDEGTSTVTVTVGADANGDGLITIRDVILLRQYLANYDYDKGYSEVVLGPQ